MLWWTKASVWWSNRSAVVTCDHASSASLSTRLHLTDGDVESEEPSRYGLGHSGHMAPKDLGLRLHHLGLPSRECWHQTSRYQ
jgi:hypothetical protein